MKTLHPDIREFIGEIKTLNTVGCLRVPKENLKKLTLMLDKASVIIGSNPAPDRVTYYKIGKKTKLDDIQPPAILVVTEEDYNDDAFADRIRDKSGYFMQVKG